MEFMLYLVDLLIIKVPFRVHIMDPENMTRKLGEPALLMLGCYLSSYLPTDLGYQEPDTWATLVYLSRVGIGSPMKSPESCLRDFVRDRDRKGVARYKYIPSGKSQRDIHQPK